MPEEYKHLSGAQEDYISKYGHKTEPVACRVQSVYQNPHEKATHFHKNLSKMNNLPLLCQFVFFR